MDERGREEATAGLGDRWVRLRRIVEELLAVAPGEREALLAQRLSDPSLRDEARELLHDAEGLADEGDDVLARIPFDGESSAVRAGSGLRAASSAPERAGPWEFRRRLGAGGMGEVFLAVRADGGFTQRAAVKRLHASETGDEVVARFERERQVLASIEDPAIARLIDGGVDDAGRPYLAMEYVDGEPIDEWCDARRADVRTRVRMLVRVAHAVDAAHSRNVVHRDIKPSNVLVDRDGRPRLIDFGVAKVLDPDKDAALVTRDVARYLTPAFASPEQFAGRPPTAASDVYSLGVLAYTLLAGAAPLELTGCGAAEAVRVVQEEPPPPMGSRDIDEATATLRGATPRSLSRAFRGDLDTVVRFCLRKEPARRYGRARELAHDLERWLEGQPVLARRDSWSYRTRRFVARNRAIVAATAAAFSLLGGALWHSMDQREMLRAQAEQLRERNAEANLLTVGLHRTLNEVNTTIYRELATIPGTRRTLGRLARSMAATADRHDDPFLMEQAARAYMKIGFTSWSEFRGRDADAEVALDAFRRASEIGRELVDRPGLERSRVGVALEATAEVAETLWALGEFDDVSAEAEAAREWIHGHHVDWLERIGAPVTAGIITDLSVSDSEGRALAVQGRPAAALEAVDACLERVARSTPAPGLQRAIATSFALQLLVERERFARLAGLDVQAPAPSGWWPERLEDARPQRYTSLGWSVETALRRAREGRVPEAIAGLESALDELGAYGETTSAGLRARLTLGELLLQASRTQECRDVANAVLSSIDTALEGRQPEWVEAEHLRAARLLAGRSGLATGDAIEGARMIGLALEHAAAELARRPRNIDARVCAIDACCELASASAVNGQKRAWLDRARTLLSQAGVGPEMEWVLEERRGRVEGLDPAIR